MLGTEPRCRVALAPEKDKLPPVAEPAALIGQLPQPAAQLGIDRTARAVPRSVYAVNLKNVLRDIQPDRDNLAHGRLSSSGLATATLWHRDAGSGGRPPHQVTMYPV
jgi:hypothetical protein